MSHRPHDLAAEFPEYADRLHTLKAEDAHFVKLAAAYDDVNTAIHRAETLVDPISPAAEVDLRKERVQLKDQIYRMLVQVEV